jgi:hypothetical protein
LIAAAAGNTDSTPRGPAIDVFYIFGDGCYRTIDSTLQGAAINVFFKLRWWMLPDIPASHRRLAKLGTCRQYFSGDTYQGGTAANTATSKTCFVKKIFSGSCGAKNLRIITSQKFKSTNCGPVLFIGKREEKAASRAGPMHLWACV